MGRDRELHALRLGLQDARAGRGGLFLITGEPGIGKTRLATALGEEAASHAWVLWGRCWEGGGAPAFWPWVQVLRSYSRVQSAHGVGLPLDPERAGLAALLDRGSTVGEAVDAATPEVDYTRFRLFDAVTVFLTDAARQQPLVVVLEDLHAADQLSLLLLQFMTRELSDARIVVVCTYRENEVRRSPVQSRLLGGLAPAGALLPLRALSADEVGAVIAARFAGPTPTRVNAVVHAATGGNPFFVDAVLRLLSADADWRSSIERGSDDVRVPDSVRETVRRRLEPLRSETRRVLMLAAVIGRDFDLPVLNEVAVACHAALPNADTIGQPTPGRLISLLDEGVAAGIIAEAGDVVGRYGFVHALIRETLRHELPPAQRVRLHGAVAGVLERGISAAAPNYAELAHHYYQAAAAGGAEKAAHYAQVAGEQALALLAFEDAAQHYARALEALKFCAADDTRRCELLLRLGDAQRRGVTPDGSGDTFQRAATLARALGAPVQLARAALGFARAESGVLHETRVALLSETLAALDPGDSVWRARVMARLAMALYFAPATHRPADLSADALAMARRLDDASALVATLTARHFAIWGPDSIAERLHVATELVQHAEAIGEMDLAAEGRLWRLVDLLELGDVAGFLDDWNALLSNTLIGRVSRYRWNGELLRAMRALAEGRLDDAEQHAQAAQGLGRDAQVARAEQFFGVQMFWIRRRQGRLAELEGAVRAFADQYTALPIWRCGLALLCCELGRHADAESLFTRLALEGFADIPRDGNWLPAMAQLSEVCVALDDRARAAQLYDLLAPHAPRNALIAEAVAYLGPVSYYLGLLATLLGRWDDAAAHLEDARQMTTRLGATLHLAYIQDAVTSLQRARGATSLAAPPIPQTSVPAVWRRDGDFWTVQFEGTALRLKDGRGPFYIGFLLMHAGEALAATELVAAAHGGSEPPPSALVHDPDLHLDTDTAVPLLDAQAKAAYRRRLRELNDELEEAEGFNDTGRIERARDEIEQLSHALSSALGLGGRDRTAPTSAERARIAVTKAITLVFKALDRDHPALRDYLRRTVKTGRFCSFTPDPRQPVQWQL